MTDSLRILKKGLREQVLAIRDQLSSDIQTNAAHSLENHAELIGDVKGKVVSSFWPIRSEINPYNLTQELKQRGAQLALPVVMDKTTLEFRAYDHDDDLIDAGFGTKGPSANAAVVDPDILLVPLAVFDLQCGRIGYGAGFYDRAIAKLRAKGRLPKTFGIAFEQQMVDQVPQDGFDIKLDYILTPEKTYKNGIAYQNPAVGEN
ncbi:MAG: 5-formyltetrahydrofolate cyclo-ligase [Hyphomicrobiales bacterium]